MRGVVAFVVAIFLLLVLLIGGGMVMDGIVPVVDEFVTDHETGATDGWGDHVDRITQAMFVWVPLFMLVVTSVWGVIWYLRRERHQGPTPR